MPKGMSQEQWALMRNAVACATRCTRAAGAHQAESLNKEQRAAVLEAAEQHARDCETLDNALAATVRVVMGLEAPPAAEAPAAEAPEAPQDNLQPGDAADEAEATETETPESTE